MERPDRYWSGVFWDGVDEAALDARYIDDFISHTTEPPVIPHQHAVVRQVRHWLAKHRGCVDEYRVSLMSVKCRMPAVPKAVVAVLIARLWPADVFAGARDGGCVDECECRDLWFLASTGAFIREASIEETETMVDDDATAQ